MQRNIEELTQQIRQVYQQYGYSQFKMNKFEEYDTYVKNKDFLISDKVITFTDTNGKLLALKPDVTISIIKNSEDSQTAVQRVYYNENVYRVSDGSHAFREIMQTGLECIGNISLYNIYEVIMLAAKSLECINNEYVIDVSHMGIVTALMEHEGIEGSLAAKILVAVSEKNLPELKVICDENGLSAEQEKRLTDLITAYGTFTEVSEKLDSFCVDEATTNAVSELRELCLLLEEAGLSDRIRIDFSVVNDMKYYNGIVFRGYVDGVPKGVLSGGQYDRLMAKMGKKSKAIGFAVYLDMIERLFAESREFDADVLLCFEKGVSVLEVSRKAREIVASGKSVMVQEGDAENIYCREKIVISEGGAEK